MAPEFVTIAKTGDVNPGEIVAFEVGGVRVAVANVDGTFYALGDTCPHADCSLAEGDVDGTTVICPCHGSEFDVTSGKVLRHPAKESVESYPVRVQEGALSIEV